MGDTRDPSALSLEERNSVGVGTFQPSFGFKDFHQRRNVCASESYLSQICLCERELLIAEGEVYSNAWNIQQLRRFYP
jgi:hypothetical protein